MDTQDSGQMFDHFTKKMDALDEKMDKVLHAFELMTVLEEETLDIPSFLRPKEADQLTDLTDEALRADKAIMEEITKDRVKPIKDDPWKHRSTGMRCHTCVFYVPKVPQYEEVAVEDSAAVIGRCRRSNPTMKGYPAVYPNDWCGEHRIDENKL